jgi:predicted esterase
MGLKTGFKISADQRMKRRHLTLTFAALVLPILPSAGVIAAASHPPIKKTEKIMDSAIVLQRPTGAIQQLVLFFHGVGSNAQDLVPVAQQFAQVLKHAMVVSVNGAQPSDFGSGVTEANRAARVAAVMPSFQSTVKQWQELAGVGADKTILVGFSQGSIMALESTQLQPTLAGRVIAFLVVLLLNPKSPRPQLSST